MSTDSLPALAVKLWVPSLSTAPSGIVLTTSDARLLLSPVKAVDRGAEIERDRRTFDTARRHRRDRRRFRRNRHRLARSRWAGSDCRRHPVWSRRF